MARYTPLTLTTALLLVGCGELGFRHSATFATLDSQLCVETALRRHPDASTLELARDRFRAACADEDMAACSALGVMYEQGLALPEDYDRAAVLFEMACEGGNDAGCVNLGRAYAEGRGKEFDGKRAAELFTVGCAKDDPRGCTELARMLATGEGVPRDIDKGAKLFAKACEMDHPEACYEVAKLHDDAIIGPDPVAAMTFFEKACLAGVGDSCERLVRIHDRQLPTVAKVRHPGETACRKGDSAACHVVGVAYYAGAGVSKDSVSAAAFLTRACDAGYEPSCNVLGPLLHGACARGEEDSCRALKRLAHAP